MTLNGSPECPPEEILKDGDVVLYKDKVETQKGHWRDIYVPEEAAETLPGQTVLAASSAERAAEPEPVVTESADRDAGERSGFRVTVNGSPRNGLKGCRKKIHLCRYL